MSPGDKGSGIPDREMEPDKELESDQELEADRELEPDKEPEPAQEAAPDQREADQELEALRTRILELDETLVRLVGERRRLVLEIGRRKEVLGMPVMDPGREARVVRRAARLAREEGIDQEMVRDILWRIIASAREAQEGRTSWGPPDPP